MRTLTLMPGWRRAILPVLLVAAGYSSEAQVAAWETAGLVGNEASLAASTANANLTIGALTRGAGLNASTLSNAFSSNNFLNTGLAGAQSANKFLQFTITANSGWEVSLSTLDANFRRSSTGPNAFQWQYSLDGFATAGINIGAQISYTGTASNGEVQAQIDLSAIPGLQDVPAGVTITFRLFGWGTDNTGGTFAIGRLVGNDLAIGGTVAPGAGPMCGISLGAANAVCNSQTQGPGNDTYDLSIPYTGVDATISVINNSGSGTVGGDDPALVSDGVIVISGISEDDAYSITFTSPCDALTVSGAAPSCEPPFLGTTISFDDDLLWSAGSAGLTAYASDHSYAEADWNFTGGPALRNGIGAQDGFPGALDTYSWRLRDVTTTDWRATYQGGDIIENFGFSVRRWDASPSPAFEVSYSTDGGATFSAAVAVIDNAFLGNSSNWKVFSHIIPSPAFVVPGQFVVRVASTGTTERIMVDNFTFETSLGPACPFALEGIPNFDENTCGCELGYFATITEINGNDVITACTICPPGSYCPDGIEAFPCAAGSFSSLAGQVVCNSCAAGTFSSSVGATFCTSCPAGTFSDVVGAESCTSCPAGSFSSTVGSTVCESCPAGSFSDVVGSVECTSCPAGSFSATTGSTVCESCPEGTFSAVTGSTSCAACPAGFANNLTGQTACSACPPGSFSANSGQVACDLCPAGTFNPVSAAISCTACPSGEGSGEGAVACVPDVACEEVTLEFYTSTTPADLSWEIIDVQSNTVVITGQGFVMPPDAVFPFIYCLPGDRQYKLRVTDNGDGASGYQLRYTATQARIIDNIDNLGTGTSEISGNAYSFSLPVSNNALIYTSCDKFFWRTGEYIVAAEDAAVSALWVIGGANSVQPNNTGYEFWFYNPNGGYSFRKFRPHNVSDGFGNVGATRACHLKVNNWPVANHIPQFDLMNVRVRSRVNGVNTGWGTACRFVRDEALAACPPTKLMDIPGNQFLSCNQFRQWNVAGSRIHARPVSGANLYEWRLRIPAENVEIIRTSTSYFLNLNWTALVAPPLQNSKTYEVDVRASKDGGATWCGINGDPWGDICSLTIGTPPAVGGNQNMSLSTDGALAMWPNPNNGTEVWISLEDIDTDIETVSVDIHDLTGKRISARILPTQDGSLLAALPLNGDLAAGMYTVTVIAGEAQYVQRLVIQP